MSLKTMAVDENPIDLRISELLIISLDRTIEIINFLSGVTAFQYLKENLQKPAVLPDLILLDIVYA